MKTMKTMKRTVMTVLAGMALTACDGMMDFHQQYLEGGEIVYLSPPRSVEFLAGKDRVVVKMAFYNSPNVKSIDVYWNNGKDSLIYTVPVPLSAGADTVYVPVPLVDAKGYNFTVYSTDAHGNRSLPVTGFGTSYGALYQSSLSNQPVRRVALSEDGGMVQWSLKAEGLLSNEIHYRKRDGLDTVVTTPADVDNSILPNIQLGVKMTYRSSFLPEPTAADTFYTDLQEYATPFPSIVMLDKSKMTVVAYSDERVDDGGGVQMILNDDPTTFWHSRWSPDAPLPHWAIIDMRKSRSNISKIEVYRRLNSYDAKTVEFCVGDDPTKTAAAELTSVTDWRPIGSVVYEFSGLPEYNMKVLDIAPITDTSGRYLLLYLPDSNRAPFTSLSRIDIYTPN
ncbi:hypothetical protein SAMD00024442_50_18 [Candidatus Symbiothrix dinenymphae]|nr:hypothetical protein SAMD00024442_50_18 [Candidatus Symbiothrix dinenymphae]